MAYDPLDDWQLLISRGGRKSKNLAPFAPQKITKNKMKKQMNIFVSKTPPVIMKITSFAKSDAVKDHLNYIARDAYLIKDDVGLSLTEDDVKNFSDTCINNAELSNTHSEKRVSMNFMVTKPYDVDKDRFEEDLLNSLYDSFESHSFVYAIHDDSTVHAHVVVSFYNDQQQALNPDRDFIARIKDNFAEQTNKESIKVQSFTKLSRGKLTTQNTKLKANNFQGIVMEYGKAPYNFDNKKSKSFFIKLGDEKNNQTYWGVDLETLVKEKNIKVGEVIKLNKKGRSVVDIKDKKGNVIRQQEKTAWSVEKKQSVYMAIKSSGMDAVKKRGEALLRLSQWAKKDGDIKLGQKLKEHFDIHFSKEKQLHQER